MEEIKITRIKIETLYHIETDDDTFRKLVRYSKDDWFIDYGNKEIKVEETEELETNFQRLLLLNITSDN